MDFEATHSSKQQGIDVKNDINMQTETYAYWMKNSDPSGLHFWFSYLSLVVLSHFTHLTLHIQTDRHTETGDVPFVRNNLWIDLTLLLLLLLRLLIRPSLPCCCFAPTPVLPLPKWPRTKYSTVMDKNTRNGRAFSCLSLHRKSISITLYIAFDDPGMLMFFIISFLFSLSVSYYNKLSFCLSLAAAMLLCSAYWHAHRICIDYNENKWPNRSWEMQWEPFQQSIGHIFGLAYLFDGRYTRRRWSNERTTTLLNAMPCNAVPNIV